MIDISKANLNVLFMNSWQGVLKRSHEGLGVSINIAIYLSEIVLYTSRSPFGAS